MWENRDFEGTAVSCLNLGRNLCSTQRLDGRFLSLTGSLFFLTCKMLLLSKDFHVVSGKPSSGLCFFFFFLDFPHLKNCRSSAGYDLICQIT